MKIEKKYVSMSEHVNLFSTDWKSVLGHVNLTFSSRVRGLSGPDT